MSRFITCSHEQGTEGWHQDRLGKVTGSNVSAVFAAIKSGEAATRANYRMDLVLERITDKPAEPDFIKTKDMEWGNQQEPHARMACEMNRDIVIGESGFVYLPNIAAGSSVDGWIDGGRGIAEIKCPKSKNHYAWLVAGVVPAEHLPQITHNLWVTGAEYCLFMSFDPRMPDGLQEFYVTVPRDEVAIKKHEAGVLQFLAEVDRDEKQMRALVAQVKAKDKE